MLKPFLKWAGGKGQLLDSLKSLMPQQYNRYYEPFIGGGALFLSVEPPNALINDANDQLVNLYEQIKNETENVIATINALDSIQCTQDLYLEKRDRYNELVADNVHSVESASLFIWLNKHCFNGLYRVNKKGLFNVPYNKKQNGASIVEENIRNIGHYLSNNNVEITLGDFATCCENVAEGDFVYFDSPYVPISETASFTDYAKEGFAEEDHRRLCELFKELTNRGAFVMLSNNDVSFFSEMYDGFNIQSVGVKRLINRNANDRTSQEVIITNY